MAGWHELNKNDKGQYAFVLKAGNHQVIGTSQMVASVASRDSGVTSVMTNGPGTTVKDNR